ncbi:MAG: M48 family metallopeptidase [Campylobacterales bacterium]
MFEKIEIKRDAKSRKLRVEVCEGGSLLVTAPRFLSEARCLEFVGQNTAKLQKMIKKQLEFEEKRDSMRGHFLYLGSKMPIGFDCDIRKKYLFDDGILTLSKKEHFREFLRDEAKRIITPKAEDIASFYSVKYEKISFRDVKSRWGSCSARKNLSFSSRLVGAPKSVIEYVVTHEICHLKELNHSPRFWSHVSALLPSYKESEKWLKENGRLLYLY